MDDQQILFTSSGRLVVNTSNNGEDIKKTPSFDQIQREAVIELIVNQLSSLPESAVFLEQPRSWGEIGCPFATEEDWNMYRQKIPHYKALLTICCEMDEFDDILDVETAVNQIELDIYNLYGAESNYAKQVSKMIFKFQELWEVFQLRFGYIMAVEKEDGGKKRKRARKEMSLVEINLAIQEKERELEELKEKMLTMIDKIGTR